jgi:hypothetical protein
MILYLFKLMLNQIIVSSLLVVLLRCGCFVQNTVIIHSLEGRSEAGTRLARILLWIYVLSALPISILLSFFLQTVPLL